MKRIIGTVLAIVVTAVVTRAQDPAKTDADKYRVVLDNAQVRVLDYSDKPGDKTSMHSHPNHVVYALTSFSRKFTLPDGKTMVREFKPGEVFWLEAQTHAGENVGQTDTHVIIVELKESAKEAAPETKGVPKAAKSGQ
ncbi:MAG TPA: hypothetical protein VN285_04845 [Candidatus Deferrimicrobium sp.]|nr:hypothetical protein [Candidatus Deferrimicrobium sp.]